jgi:hypothetical protein
MDDPLGRAKLYLAQAEQMQDLGLNEKDRRSRRMLLAIAEYYFLLHDKYVELGQLDGPGPLHPGDKTVVH